jgi:hypothetical protein
MPDHVWRKSSYSDNGKCLEIAQLDDTILIRNSNHPNRTTFALQPGAVAAFIAACSTGYFDDLRASPRVPS